MNNEERLKELNEKLKLVSINRTEYDIPSELFKNEINEFCYLFMTGLYKIYEFDLESVFYLVVSSLEDEPVPLHTKIFCSCYRSFLEHQNEIQRISKESNSTYDFLNNKEAVCSMLSQQQITDDDFVLVLREFRNQIQKMYVEAFLSNSYIFPKRRRIPTNFSEKQIENLFSFLHVIPYEVQRAILDMCFSDNEIRSQLFDSKMREHIMNHYRARPDFEQKECFKEFKDLGFEF